MDETETMPECCFKNAEQLIKNIYSRHPDIFLPDFNIKKIHQYITGDFEGGMSPTVHTKKRKPVPLLRRKV